MLPKNLSVPEEVVADRTSSSITLTFEAVGQFATKLVIQAMPKKTCKDPLDPFGSFSTTSAVGGKNHTSFKDDAGSATRAVVECLDPATAYFFRLVATNPAGTTYGPVTEEAIPTLGKSRSVSEYMCCRDHCDYCDCPSDPVT